ncbi:MAG: metallophosphoesterase [Gemmataceae bacterium]
MGYLLFFAAWVGHAALWLVALNVLYSRPIHKTVLKLARLAVAVITFGFPIALWAAAGFDLLAVGQTPPRAVQLYLGLCFFTAFCAIPFVTVKRLMRPDPPQLVGRKSAIFDTARFFGAKPAGDGKYRRLALLPGNQVFQVELTELTLRLPGLPAAWDGLTILHLSDLHLCGTPDQKFYESVIDQCLAAGIPDVLAITGDLVDSDVHHRWLLPLLRPLRWREAGLAILGNHDYWETPDRVRRRLQKLGLVVLGNGWRQVTVRGEPLVAIGHEGPWFRPEPDLAGCPAGPFRLCLSHSPDNIRWARRHRVNLMLSGHNHGGQIRLPLFGSLFVPSLYSRRYDCGLFWEEPTLLHVNRGLAGREPLRYNCRPEVTRLVVKV